MAFVSRPVCAELEYSDATSGRALVPNTSRERNIGLASISVLPNRLRAKWPEKVAELAESMKAQGLLQPIVLRPASEDLRDGYFLVAGRHRYEAARFLKWESIRATVFEGMAADAAELAEIDENLIRADLSPAERALHMGERKRLYEKLHPETQHGAIGRGRKKSSQNEKSFVEDTAAKTGKGRSTVAREVARANKVAVLRDIAGTSLDKGDEIDALARLPEEKQKELAIAARQGSKVSAKIEAKRERRAMLERALGNKQKALPQKKYGVILADPEWKHVPWSPSGMDRAADNHYPTSPTEVIASRPVASIAAKHSVLFLWAVVPMLPEALRVMEAWGFTYRTSAVWSKRRPGRQMGLGYWFRIDHEILLVEVRGKPPAPAPGTQWRSVIEAPVGAHSAKPECVLELIEAYFPTLPKIELNRRGPARDGWDAWGNEVTPEFAIGDAP
jgi:ParB/RepB/Spo0J family partition protein